ncbi:hypothetical protein [Micromonospora chalcea]|nr:MULTISPECIES: hypothetical protein [Micromonospora]MCT2278921.1 hypothetical protein [Micromonospora chalcea]
MGGHRSLYAEGEDARRCTVVLNSLRAAALPATDSPAMIEEIRGALSVV